MSIGGVLNSEIDETPLRRRMQDEAKVRGVTIDTDAMLLIIARWVGWYRLESDKEMARTPRQQRTEAEHIVALLAELYERMQPHKMSPDFRAELRENMRTLGVSTPDWARLLACARKACEQLRTPRQGQRLDTAPKHNAIRAIYEAIGDYTTPPMDKEPARALAAELLSIGADVSVPSDKDELRKITG